MSLSSLSLLVISFATLLTFSSCRLVYPQALAPQVRYSQPQLRQQVSYPQPVGRQVAPQYVPHKSPYVYSHRRLIDPVTNAVVYHHSYAYNNNSHHEMRSWINSEGRPVQPVLERALAHQEAPLSMRPHPFIRELDTRPQPLVDGQQPAHNQRNQLDNRRALEKSSEISSPVILKQAEPTWFSNIETIVSFIKSPTFLSQVGTIGSHSAFKSHIVGDKMSEDEKLNRLNMEKTGLNFSINDDDCKPKMTTIKFGRIDMPEIIFNPSSVEILRCPQACFSWQFDCVPTKRESKNISIATYFTNGGSITRKVDSITIDSHTACACSCQSFAGCFGNVKMGSQRLPPSP